MRLYTTSGRLVYKNVTQYLIDWDKKSRSKIQFKVKQFLKNFWENHIVYEEFPVYGSRLKVDILNATKKIAVEINGKQHTSFNEFFHKDRVNYLSSLKRDHKKGEWLRANDFELLEIEENEIKNLSLDFIQKKFGINI